VTGHSPTRRRGAAIALLAAGLLLAALAPGAAAAVTLSPVADGFTRPLYVTHAFDSRLFVVEQGGRIWVLHGSNRTLFLDISTRVACCGEQGLLGLAFHPGYATNRLFYVNYTRASDGATVVAEYRRSAGDPNLADPHATYNRTVIVIAQPQAHLMRANRRR
jgi:glucose/arabinose dehydrogenase